MKMSDTVILKNGAEEHCATPPVIMGVLESLFKNDPMGFYELVQVARDRNHQMWGNYAQKLEAYSGTLLQGGQMHDSVRNVILSAVSGDGFDMVLDSPYAE
jgi:hypothetical protein